MRPEGGKDTAASIPGAKLLMIEGMGHALPIPMWPQIIDAIDKHAHAARYKSYSTRDSVTATQGGRHETARRMLLRQALRYVAEGEPMLKAQCHCRECQYISGGAPNMFVLMPIDGFSYTKGERQGILAQRSRAAR